MGQRQMGVHGGCCPHLVLPTPAPILWFPYSLTWWLDQCPHSVPQQLRMSQGFSDHSAAAFPTALKLFDDPDLGGAVPLDDPLLLPAACENGGPTSGRGLRSASEELFRYHCPRGVPSSEPATFPARERFTSLASKGRDPGLFKACDWE